MSEEIKVRKRRKDAGTIMATRRDLYCIAWIAEQYAVRGDQLRRLLSRFPDPKKPFKDGKLMAATTVRDQISRWERAGWIEYKRVLADEEGFAWVTRRGLQLVDLDEIYTARTPASVRLDHLYAVNQVRLALDQKYVWQSERRYRSELETEKAKDLGPIPDGIITTSNGRIVIEVEISEKKRPELEAKLERLTTHWRLNNGRQSVTSIWFYVPSEKVKTLVESAYGRLTENDRKRVSVAVIETGLLPTKFR